MKKILAGLSALVLLAGFTNLFNLTNGIADWQANGLPLVTG